MTKPRSGPRRSRSAAKRRNRPHLIDKRGARLLESCLPDEWVLRQYRPDYGLDFSLEIFSPVSGAPSDTFETLGEHLFIQLKTVSSITPRTVKVYGRVNVEKTPEVLDRSYTVGTLEVVTHSLDGRELATIERMGVGVPVLMVVADLAAQRCYFVCINDYIDKILVPRFQAEATRRSRSVQLPIRNVLKPAGSDGCLIRWYGKRAKLMAAFQRFIFQSESLGAEQDCLEVIALAKYFGTRIASYDFWENAGIWEILGHYGSAVKCFLESGDATALRLEPGITEYEHRRGKEGAQAKARDILRLWKLLALLPGNFEDVCREWFLPTAIGWLSSYSPAPRNDSVESKVTRPRLGAS